MVRENQMRAIANVQAAFDLNVGLGKCLDFGHQRGGIDDHAGTDHRVLLRAQNAARDELQDVAVLANDYRVPGIVPAGTTRNVIEGPGEIIDDFAFAFVTPLSADHYDRFHSPCFSQTAKFRSAHFTSRSRLRAAPRPLHAHCEGILWWEIAEGSDLKSYPQPRRNARLPLQLRGIPRLAALAPELASGKKSPVASGAKVRGF